MSEIRRTGPPTPREVKGKLVTWRSILCDPNRIRFYLGTMIFDSDEANVPIWIEFIEKWMASANARYAERLRQEQAAREEDAVDPAQRLRDLEEKFKNL